MTSIAKTNGEIGSSIIDCLPSEIISQIFEALYWDAGNGPLIIVTRVCRAWHELGLQILYRDCVIATKTTQDRLSSDPGQPDFILPFVSTAYSPLVRSLTLKRDVHCQRAANAHSFSDRPFITTKLLTNLRSLSLWHIPKDAYALSFLQGLPDCLISLEIDLNHGTKDRDGVLDSAMCRSVLNVFDRLRHFRLRCAQASVRIVPTQPLVKLETFVLILGRDDPSFDSDVDERSTHIATQLRQRYDQGSFPNVVEMLVLNRRNVPSGDALGAPEWPVIVERDVRRNTSSLSPSHFTNREGVWVRSSMNTRLSVLTNLSMTSPTAIHATSHDLWFDTEASLTHAMEGAAAWRTTTSGARLHPSTAYGAATPVGGHRWVPEPGASKTPLCMDGSCSRVRFVLGMEHLAHEQLLFPRVEKGMVRSQVLRTIGVSESTRRVWAYLTAIGVKIPGFGHELRPGPTVHPLGQEE